MTIEELKVKADAGDHQALMELARQLDLAERPVETIEVLSRAANRGNIHARFMVAVRLLVGYHVPVRPADALRLLSECSQQGHAEAAALLAVALGVGAYTRQDLPHALDLLQLAAERGSRHAQQQLAVLAGQGELESLDTKRGSISYDLWKRLRLRIDPGSWTAPVDFEKLNEAPLVGRVNRLVSDDICKWMIDRSRHRLVRAEIYNSVRGITQVNETRTNTTAIFGLLEADLVSIYIQMRMTAAARVPFNNMEAAAVLHYDPGERITEHFDFIDPRTPGYEEEVAKNGQRVVTFLLYLNDDYEGGETDFPHLNISHKGKKGEGLFFFNADEAGTADMRTVHAGRPPLKGEKWIISQFIRNRATTPGSESRH